MGIIHNSFKNLELYFFKLILLIKDFCDIFQKKYILQELYKKKLLFLKLNKKCFGG